MADKKTTELDAIATIEDTDVLPIVDLTDTTTKKITVAQIKTTTAPTEEGVVAALDGASIDSTTVAGTDKVIIQDVDDSDNIKTVSAQDIADLGGDAVHWSTSEQEAGFDDDGNTVYKRTFNGTTGASDSLILLADASFDGTALIKQEGRVVLGSNGPFGALDAGFNMPIPGSTAAVTATVGEWLSCLVVINADGDLVLFTVNCGAGCSYKATVWYTKI